MNVRKENFMLFVVIIVSITVHVLTILHSEIDIAQLKDCDDEDTSKYQAVCQTV